MKKLIIKCIIMAALFMGVSQYFVYITTGKTPFDNFNIPNFSLNKQSISNFASDGKQTVYKWVDEKGVTQYSAQAPSADQQVKTLEIDPNMNIVQGLQMPEDEKEEESSKPEISMPTGPIYSPESIKKLVDDAKNIEKLLQDRMDKQEKILSTY